MKLLLIRRIFLIALLSGIMQVIDAQKVNSPLKDTLDHKFDLSNYVINMHGIIPFPVLISEPALGNFGGALALLYVRPKKSLNGEQSYHFPDITGIAGLYTLNNTWGAGAFRQGSFPAIGMRYRVIAAYADVNLNFYREIPGVGEQKFLINMKPIYAVIDLSENLFKNKIFLGLKYEFMNVSGNTDLSLLPDSIFNPDDFNKNSGNIGIYGEWDNRNSMFTPDRGIQFKVSFSLARSYTASDFDFEKVGIVTNVFLQPFKRWVCGLRANVQGISDEAPFYLYPYLYMRGIPAMRYQGNATLSFETEQRVDITPRWSILGFAGTGRTYSNSESLKDDSWHWAGGAGFRYLLSRIFKMRMGIDIAAGPDQFAYYIVLGHYWNL